MIGSATLSLVLAAGPAETELTALRWRSLGPWRGGRSIACAGTEARPLEYYFGATGGGLWKTEDSGHTWLPVTDGQIRSASVGAVAVSPSHSDVVYIGMGETQLRGNVLQGDGVYRSTDSGRTWKHLGLEATKAISRIRVHPDDPDLVYVAALGDPTRGNPERGIYRSKDGGTTLERILYIDDETGAVDLVLDPGDPRKLYAALWQVYRIPWKLWSGGPGSGIFRSRDGGDTWTKLTDRPGLPQGVLGKIGLAVSPKDSARIYAVIEAEEGGLYRSDDGGESFELVNGSRDLWQRSFYFNRLTADPSSRDGVYILNYDLNRSRDGGASYERVPTHHLDYHDLWISTRDPNRMMVCNDGGAEVTTNGGATWSHQLYPTAQIYRVETTAHVPYHVVGAQQDNTSVGVPSRDGGLGHLAGFSFGGRDDAQGLYFYAIGGGESGFVAPHPAEPDVYFGSEPNWIVRTDRRSGRTRNLVPWPWLQMGAPARDWPERWNWTTPLVFSPIPPHDFFAASQHVWRSRDLGQSFERISPDLTRSEPETLGETGGPLVLDQDGPEIYATITALSPSPLDRQVLWTGSDDGLVHVTRDDGAAWRNVTPSELPPHTRIASLSASHHEPGGVVLAARRNQLGDRGPWAFRSEDFGATWRRIDAGLPSDETTYVLREDPTEAGLLYAGTERGVYVSSDYGWTWQSLRLNLPVTPVMDLKVEDHDLVAATHGRGFWVLEGLAPLRQIESIAGATHLFRPEGATRGLYPAAIDVLAKEEAEATGLEILDRRGNVVRRLTIDGPLPEGHSRIEWDLRTDGATIFPGMILEAPNPARGVAVPPGSYTVRLSAAGGSSEQEFTVAADPRVTRVSADDYAAQYALARELRDAVSRANEAVLRIRDVTSRLPESSERRRALAAIEAVLYQARNRSPKDKLAFPIRLNDRLAGLMHFVQMGDGPPTPGQREVAAKLIAELHEQLARLKELLP